MVRKIAARRATELKKVDQALAEIDLELNLVPESKIAAATKTKIEAAKATSPP